MGDPQRILVMGMVGGGRGAFIGEVHRIAARLDGQAQLVSACLASSPQKSRESGREIGLDPARTHPTWQAMLEAELKLPPGERIDFVSIVTPNHLHFPIARAFAEAGIHIVCDKPLARTMVEARELIEITRRRGIVFAVSYNYAGYPMVKQARELVRSGALGPIRTVIVEYRQGWLASNLEASGHKQAAWRTDPALAGAGGAIADIGSHAEQLVSHITGLEIDSICADLASMVPGRRVDDDAAMLLRFIERDGVAARGILAVSQVASGSENDLAIRISGERASLHWRQESPNELVIKSNDGPEQVHRPGHGWLAPAALAASRLPPGHPEGFLEAFANIYRGVFAAIRAHPSFTGDSASDAFPQANLDWGASFDFPSIFDGARGVHFIENALESARSDRKWTPARFTP